MIHSTYSNTYISEMILDNNIGTEREESFNYKSNEEIVMNTLPSFWETVLFIVDQFLR